MKYYFLFVFTISTILWKRTNLKIFDTNIFTYQQPITKPILPIYNNVITGKINKSYSFCFNRGDYIIKDNKNIELALQEQEFWLTFTMKYLLKKNQNSTYKLIDAFYPCDYLFRHDFRTVKFDHALSRTLRYHRFFSGTFEQNFPEEKTTGCFLKKKKFLECYKSYSDICVELRQILYEDSYYWSRKYEKDFSYVVNKYVTQQKLISLHKKVSFIKKDIFGEFSGYHLNTNNLSEVFINEISSHSINYIGVQNMLPYILRVIE